MKLLLDASISATARSALTAAGHDVTWAGDLADNTPPTDAEILDRALREHRVLVTLDRDLGEHALVRRHAPPMLRVCNFKATQQAQVVLQVLAAHGPELARGAVVTVEPGTLRIRLPDAER
ncbi:MAG: DUF5615 family PIN-like protein [Chromatiales bacterium]